LTEAAGRDDWEAAVVQAKVIAQALDKNIGVLQAIRNELEKGVPNSHEAKPY